jgi:hypothetical protein
MKMNVSISLVGSEKRMGTDLVHTTGFSVRIPRLGFKDEGST